MAHSLDMLRNAHGGAHCVDPVVFDFYVLISEVADFLELSARQKQLPLYINIPESMPEFLRSDPDKIRQIILSLATNAIKYTDSGKVVIDIDFDAQASCFTLHVQDTGCGIPRAQLDTIFEQEREGDKGVPLALCYKMVVALEGRIDISSQVTKGTSCSVTIPCTTEDKQHEESQSDRRYTTAMRLLAFDHSKSYLAIIHDYVSTWHMRCTTTKSQEQAAQILLDAHGEDGAYMLCLIGPNVAKEDAKHFIRRLRSHQRLDTCRIIVNTDDFDMQEEQISALLQPSFTPSMLYRACIGTLQSSQKLVASHKEKPRILVVGGASSYHDVLFALKKKGYHIDDAEDESEAAELTNHMKYHLAFFDEAMDYNHFVTLYTQIQQREGIKRQKKKVPFILLAQKEASYDKKIFSSMLTKPVQRRKLYEAVEQCSVLS